MREVAGIWQCPGMRVCWEKAVGRVELRVTRRYGVTRKPDYAKLIGLSRAYELRFFNRLCLQHVYGSPQRHQQPMLLFHLLQEYPYKLKYHLQRYH